MHRNTEWFLRQLLRVAFNNFIAREEDGGILFLRVGAQQSVYVS